MATKPELEKEVKALKAEIRTLRKSSKSTSIELDSLPFNGVGVGLDEKGAFHLVNIKFDLESKSAVVGETFKVLSHMPKTTSYAKMAIVDEIVKLDKEKRQ